MRWSTSAAPGLTPSRAPRALTGGATALLGLVSIAFPFAILFAADHIGVWPIIALLAAAAGLRMLAGGAGAKSNGGLGVMIAAQAGAVGAIVLIGLLDEALAARLYPVAVSVALLCVFAGSLVAGPPVIERLARLTEPDLPPEGVAYCRSVTLVWCAFFVLNGAAALYTALWADRAVWAIYNGFVSYCLMGALFAVEYVVRLRVRRRAAA